MTITRYKQDPGKLFHKSNRPLEPQGFESAKGTGSLIKPESQNFSAYLLFDSHGPGP
ncbi:hypothetical protein SynA18461_01511 [Synechococcus sp. A18-46.1]|nr:hypothetical protein SynA18461_01511 [Synechococcus sp. A18-46.1]